MINKIGIKERVKFTLSFDSILDLLILWTLIISLLLFILYPIVMVISTSFFYRGTFTLENYKNLFTQNNLKLIKNSLFVVSISSILAAIFSLCIALYTFNQKRKFQNIILKALMISMISPPFVSSLALIALFGRRGLITHNLLGLSVNPYGWQGIILLQTLGKIPLSTIMIITALNSIDMMQLLASRDLGASPSDTLKNIILPALSPTILAVLFLNFTMNLADFGTPIIIGGKFKMLATETYKTIFASADLGKAAAMSVLLIPPAILAFLFYRKNMKNINNKSNGNKVLDNSEYHFELPSGLNIILGLITTIFFLIIILKYGSIFLLSISNNASGRLTFTLDHIKKVKSLYLTTFIRSIVFAIIAGIVSSILGILLSYYTHRRNIKGMKYMEFISSLPYIIPGIFFGLGYIVGFNNKPLLLTGTTAIVILNSTFRHISVANKAANAAFANIDTRIEDAAKDLGTSKVQTIINIILPLLKPVFLTSFINTFTACMTSVGAIIFLVSPKNVVASVVMFKDIQRGGYGQAAVMASILVLITISVNLITMKLLDKKEV
ncbi:iron(III) transport system permease protein [Keratinibaculum paraultunense]|uniref:Iron(III) transport system permease protein n=1 Tax=Keratinibaculum paraultunense TaxID=1278232 RepID=A0A4R3L0J0_9FIRM|nr:iron ABC transporter permease [Keratinibaculum paraultunense]QQY79974.1 iron ABC transporter permease [Keratinibaculum paraultunense]TCS91705.1 iron(III) transport system permease protein [Keratinibaculum paraultunense]